MKVFVVVLEDRHIDDEITVHATREGADAKIEEIKKRYDLDHDAWDDRKPRWCERLVACGDDGPQMHIEAMEVQP